MGRLAMILLSLSFGQGAFAQSMELTITGKASIIPHTITCQFSPADGNINLDLMNSSLSDFSTFGISSEEEAFYKHYKKLNHSAYKAKGCNLSLINALIEDAEMFYDNLIVDVTLIRRRTADGLVEGKRCVVMEREMITLYARELKFNSYASRAIAVVPKNCSEVDLRAYGDL